MMSASLPSSNPKAKALQAVLSSFVVLVLDLSAFFHRLLPIHLQKIENQGRRRRTRTIVGRPEAAHVE